MARKPQPLDLNPEVYLRDDWICLDFETTNLDNGSPSNRDNRLVLACWTLGRGHPSAQKGATDYHKFGSEYEQNLLLQHLQEASFVIAFNAKFELGWLRRAGVELRDLIVYDPMLGEYVLAGNRKPSGGFSLDATLKRRSITGKMRYVSALIAGSVCPSSIPAGELLRYCVRDVERTRALFLRQRAEIFRLDLARVFYGRCLQSPMLADIEARGMQLDEERVRRSFRTAFEEYNRADAELQTFCGGSVNWRSPKQVGLLVYDTLGFDEARDYRGQPIRTEAGSRSTSENVLSSLRATTEEQRRFKKLYLNLAPLKKRISILEAMNEACETQGGMVYASFNQAVTGNHRLSSTGGRSGLQFQNFPRDYKGLFRAREDGWVMGEGDCPQLEFRTGADLARDRVAKGDILARADVHSLTSAVTGYNRQEAKPHTFKPMYGGRSGPPRLRAYYDAFRERYCGIYRTQMQWVYTVLGSKCLTTATGLVFYWPDTEVTSSGYITNTPAIFNYPISMFATADIAQLSLLLLWHSLRGMVSFIVNTIHDSGILEIFKDELDRVGELMVYCYTEKIYDVLDKLYSYRFDIPLGLGFKSGGHWGEGEEQKYEPEGRFIFTSPTPTKITLGGG